MLVETAMREADRMLLNKLEAFAFGQSMNPSLEVIEALRDEVLHLRECVASFEREGDGQ